MNKIEKFNPYVGNLLPKDVAKFGLGMSDSILHRKNDFGLAVGGDLLKKLGGDETKKNRRV